MQFVSINGHTIHYKFIQHPLHKNAEGKTFLFINSLGTDFRIWDKTVDALKGYGNILLFDKRGHGLSDFVEDTKGLKDFTDDMLALLQYLFINKCVPIGISVGGMLAQLIAHDAPAKVEKLILCDTNCKIGTLQTWNERIASVKEKGLASISDGVMERWFSEKFRNKNAVKVSGYKNMLERTPVPGYIKTCVAIRDADLTEIARQIKTAALCIVGSEDKTTTPAEVKNLAGLIEGAEYKVIEGSGHIPCVDNAAVFNRLIIDFIK